MSKRLSPQEVERLLRTVLLDEGPEREAAWADFTGLVAQMGLSPEKPEDGWRLAFALHRQNGALLGEVIGGRKAAGRKTSGKLLARDAILIYEIYAARRDGDLRGEKPIIRDLAKAKNWPSHDAAVETLWRRYQALKRRNSRERQRLASLFLPEPGA